MKQTATHAAPASAQSQSARPRRGVALSPPPALPSIAMLQPRLEIGPVDDPLEREADAMASRVADGPQSGAISAAAPRVQRRTASSGTAAANAAAAPPIVHDVLRAPGTPLDTAARADLEPRFGTSFAGVRIHADAQAAASARAVGAQAYTVGRDVVFGSGHYAPQTAAGRRLLAHELTHVVQQGHHGAVLQRQPDPPLESRLQVIEEGGPAAQTRLDQILRSGGPVPTKTKVIGAAIIDIEGYTGPKEMRAISGADTDALGQGAAIYHASSPTSRTLSGTRSIAGSGPRRDFPFQHVNDAEMKLFEDIIARLPKGAKGTIHFSTVRVRQVNGQTVFEPYPACSGCIRASFETSGTLSKVDLVSHAPVHPTGSADVAETPAPSGGGTGGGGGARARFKSIGIGVGTTALSIGIGLLSSYLKARVDRKIAAAQIDRNQAKAQKVIDAEADTILKMMLTNPEQTLYARVMMSSAVISTLDVNPAAMEPTVSDSSPIIDLTGVGFTFQKLDPELSDTFQQFGGGGRHFTMVRLLVSEIPLETPSIEDLIATAKARKLPLDDLLNYVRTKMIKLDESDPNKFVADVNHWQHMLDLINQKDVPVQSKPPPAPARPPAQAHPSPPGYKAPSTSTGTLPSVQEQTGTVCPNCHTPNKSKDSWKDLSFGSTPSPFGKLPNDEASRKLMEQWLSK
ncbi:hypothetical protein SSBR45G_11960 [Bradyrhizobium sp. SSBR45G]|uniref:eCIS core domain-containing protein n=1 Tax=unclassified Bradyrhizobium TaxID=2631580 RepID=UPI002342AC79|nr:MULTISPECIES: DUF4157 domain-containing protein [unclassified Bradyrhizobium]GLH76288.1 hypothetical protein SSBR45G_11960 [Bradyrhizobium sp. SSBR45G]GLH83229.1 hypothetical protein SSBR45R_06890 [Bradyrhizobium sp. SSBR45R]